MIADVAISVDIDDPTVEAIDLDNLPRPVRAELARLVRDGWRHVSIGLACLHEPWTWTVEPIARTKPREAAQA